MFWYAFSFTIVRAERASPGRALGSSHLLSIRFAAMLEGLAVGARVPEVTPPDHDFRHGLIDAQTPILAAMLPLLTHRRLRWLWYTCYACLGPLAWFNLLSGRPGLQTLTPGARIAWAVGYAIYGLLLWRITLGPWSRFAPRARTRLVLAALMALVALCMSALLPEDGDHGDLLVITAAMAACELGVVGALAWVAVQSLAFAVTLGPALGLYTALYLTAAFVVFQVFAVLAVNTATSEARAREALSRINAELRATRQLLIEGSRNFERVRIARELHDLLGHHLTALNLNLEVARHLAPPGEVLSHVERSQAISRLLLADVREAVSAMRGDEVLDLNSALKTLLERLPGLKVHLDSPQGLRVKNPECAQVLLRCVQEVVTNTLRHAGARNLWLEVAVGAPDGLRLRVRDDGRGAARPRPGNGLCGMRERLEAIGGRLEWRSKPNEGFALEAWVPDARLPDTLETALGPALEPAFESAFESAIGSVSRA